jgi:hypothetical protein
MYLMQKSVSCCFSSYSQIGHVFNGGRKRGEDTITVLICANMDDSVMPLLVIEK